MSGLPDLRLLPDAPVPDGRTVLTSRTPQASRRSWVTAGIWRLSYRLQTRSRALNRQLRKAVKTKSHFPSEDAARKLISLAIQNALPQWTHTRGQTKALLAFKIQFGDRLPD